MEKEMSKKMKLEKDDEENLGIEIDRLSTLPVELVMRIFGFLDTKQAVQACCSLKKWVKLWTSLPNLHFDYSFFNDLSFFDNFVEKVLSLRNDSVKINKFNFHRRRTAESTSRVVSYAVSHDVCQLTISFQFHTFMNHLGTRNSIGNLELNQLVTLHLHNVTLTATEDFSGTPNLEELTLNSVMLGSLSIVAPRLLRLTISDCYFSPDKKLVLSTPRLTSFKIKDYGIPSLQADDDLTHLDKVDISLDLLYSLMDVERELLISKLIFMLNCFCNASSITLSSLPVELLSMRPEILAREPSRFCKLKHLNVVHVSPRTSRVTIPRNVTTYFLKNSPNAKIVVELPRFRKFHRQ